MRRFLIALAAVAITSFLHVTPLNAQPDWRIRVNQAMPSSVIATGSSLSILPTPSVIARR